MPANNRWDLIRRLRVKKWHTTESQSPLSFTVQTRHCSLRPHFMLHLSLDQLVSVFWCSDFAAPSWLHHINLILLWSLWVPFSVLLPQLYWIPPTIMHTKQQNALCKILDLIVGCDAVSLGQQFLWNIGNQSPSDTECHTTRHEPKW